LSTTRPPAVAGVFYPARPADLRQGVRSLLEPAEVPGELRTAKAYVVPHAGYVYSGPVAASAYARLRPVADRVERVVLLGPSHRHPFHGLALPSTGTFSTPLGEIPLDRDLARRASALPQVVESDAAHAREHSLEVQLPFLQEVLGDFLLLPFVVGVAAPGEVAEVIDLCQGGPETLILISSDLSHYLTYAACAEIDERTASAIVDLRPPIDHDQACGATPVNGVLEVARRHRWSAELLDLRNSGDTAGDRSRVVGYGAFAFYQEPTA
jgi:AmmeMemoRadiSam system protein B